MTFELTNSTKPTRNVDEDNERSLSFFQSILEPLFTGGFAQNPLLPSYLQAFNPLFRSAGIPRPGMSELLGVVAGGGLGNLIGSRFGRPRSGQVNNSELGGI